MDEIPSTSHVIDEQPTPESSKADANDSDESVRPEQESNKRSKEMSDSAAQKGNEREESKGELVEHGVTAKAEQNYEGSNRDGEEAKGISERTLEINESSLDSPSKPSKTIEANSASSDSQEDLGEKSSKSFTKSSVDEKTEIDSGVSHQQISSRSLEEDDSSSKDKGRVLLDTHGNDKSDKIDRSETSSTASSWISIDDELKVKRSHKEQIANGCNDDDSPVGSGKLAVGIYSSSRWMLRF